MTDDLKEQERAKYEKVWGYSFYRGQADGDGLIELALQQLGCKVGDSLIDWGCGKGTPAAQFAAKGLKVTGVDIAYNCLDPGVNIPLVTACLWDLDDHPNLVADYSFCTDVLEHIPPQRLDAVLDNIFIRTRVAALLQVCTILDRAGPRMDPPDRLHLSVMQEDEWAHKIRQRWPRVDMFRSGKKARFIFICSKKPKKSRKR